MDDYEDATKKLSVMTNERGQGNQNADYHQLLKELKAENIILPDVFVAGALVENLSDSWNDYKQQLKHKHKQMSLNDLIRHVIIEDTSIMECRAARAKALDSRANLIHNNTRKQQRYANKTDHALKVTNPNCKSLLLCV